jgi:hypothetical protein
MANIFDTHVIFSPPNLYLVFTKKATTAAPHKTRDEIPKVIMDVSPTSTVRRRKSSF